MGLIQFGHKEIVLASKSMEVLVAIQANLLDLVAGAIGFGVYDLQHHAHQGDWITMRT